MSALLFIRDKRRALEKIELVGMLRMVMNASKKDLEKRMETWAREAEINLIFED